MTWALWVTVDVEDGGPDSVRDDSPRVPVPVGPRIDVGCHDPAASEFPQRVALEGRALARPSPGGEGRTIEAEAEGDVGERPSLIGPPEDGTGRDAGAFVTLESKPST